jgi:DNA-binding XRE family transcriptional regulator
MYRERLRLGRNIKALRIKQQYSRMEFSLIASINYTTLMNIENGKTNPKLETLEKIARFLEVPMKVMFDDEPK